MTEKKKHVNVLPVPSRATSRARDGARKPCRDETSGWGCTRESGHRGSHEACGTDGTKYAEWES